MTLHYTPAANSIEIHDLTGGTEFVPTMMAAASVDDWALVTSPENPTLRLVRRVVAWAHGSVVYENSNSTPVREALVTAMIDLGRGSARSAVELIASGYEVTTAPREWIDAEATDD
ncbi:MAG: hypothetical protein NTW76_13775 [Corynebacteriales bacterium]|nr:hypothetical protein [Mycobacteriales bacterium]